MTVNTFKNGHSLIVGVGADLPVTISDATALRDLLIDPHRAGYHGSHVELLTEAKATRQGILQAFDRLIERTRDLQATVIVYYSGHGGRIVTSGKPSGYYIVPYGYDPQNPLETAISGAEFTTKIQAIKAEKLIVILDCCHAGGVPALKDPQDVFIKSPIPVDLLNVLDSGSGRVVIGSSREDEKSYTGTPYSVFTATLLEALDGKASFSKDGYARILDVLAYLFAQVPQRTTQRQHPFVKKVLDLSDNFPLCFYGGGAKTISDASLTQRSAGELKRLKQELDGLQGSWDLRSEKIRFMRNALVIEASSAVKFQLEKQLIDEEAELADIRDKMVKIERALDSH